MKRKRKNEKNYAFSQRLKTLIDTRDLTQQQVAEQAGVSQPAVAKWLQGARPGAVHLSNLAQANGVTSEWFLDVPEGLPSAKKEQSISIDITPPLSDTYRVKEIRSLTELLAVVRRLTKARGRKAQLVSDIHVTRQALHQWLSGDAKPSAETTFALLEWVREQGGKKT